MFKTILVPTDGSDHATRAVEIASDLASKYGARLIFVHVLLTQASPGDLRKIIDLQNLSDEAREEIEVVERLQEGTRMGGAPITVSLPVPGEALVAVGDVLLGEAEKIARNHGVENPEREWKQGDPAHCILSTAKEENVDLIVMGSRGLSDLKGLFVGSVSHKVSHLSDCSCVTVK
jgi:nucleotide-binding universal stress UspA family protein